MKKCSRCHKVGPMNSHKCFMLGLGRLVNTVPSKNSITERLYRRIIEEFPDDKEAFYRSEVRPKREGRGSQWSWCYWPSPGFCLGSAWNMTEVLKASEWRVNQTCHGEYEIYINQQPAGQE